MKKKLIVVLAGAALVAAFAVGSSLYKAQREKTLGFLAQENYSSFVRPHSHAMGPEGAEVYLVEFMDPACEACRIYYGYVKQIMKTHPGKIRLVIRYAPFHRGSETMVKILEAAGKQGKYWETLQVMFESQPQWASHHDPHPEKIWEVLSPLGLDIEKLKSDMKDPAIAKLIIQDIEDTKTLKVRKTPSFFVNGKPLPSFGYRQLVALIEAELKTN